LGKNGTRMCRGRKSQRLGIWRMIKFLKFYRRLRNYGYCRKLAFDFALIYIRKVKK